MCLVDDSKLDQIREMRNYWCHQCYLDFGYEGSQWKREMAFQKVANRLYNEHNRINKFQQKIERIYLDWFVN